MTLYVGEMSVSIKGRPILQNLDVTFGRGMTAVVGPNGAGKTTLLRVLAGLLSPTRGRAVWRGLPMAEPAVMEGYRRRLGYLPQDFMPYPSMTVEQFVTHAAAMKGVTGSARSRARAVLQMVGIEHLGSSRPDNLSSGHIRLVGLAQALVNDPEVLILDEPLRGLDAERLEGVSRLLSRRAEESTIIVSAHGSELGHLPARWLLLAGGRIRLDVDGGEFIHASYGRIWEVDAEVRPRGGRPLFLAGGGVSERDGDRFGDGDRDEVRDGNLTGPYGSFISAAPRGSFWRLRMLVPPGADADYVAAAMPPDMELRRARPMPAGAEAAYLWALAEYGRRDAGGSFLPAREAH